METVLEVLKSFVEFEHTFKYAVKALMLTLVLVGVFMGLKEKHRR